MTTIIPTADLEVGSRFSYADCNVEVLRPREDYVDRFGRDEWRFWCRREDTGAEGWLHFGHKGIVHPVINGGK